MGKPAAIAGSILFFFLVPGVVAFLIPWVLSQASADPMWRGAPYLTWSGAVLVLAGSAALIECFARFALTGLGTPAPIAPTRHLVVTGLYRFVRNPMYLAVVTIILGQSLWWASGVILAYAGLVWLAFAAFVLAYEEPTLRRSHGDAYAAYCTNVGRWLPRWSPWSPTV